MRGLARSLTLAARKVILCVAGLSPLLAQSTRLDHDGLFWVQTVSAPVTVPLSARLRITTHGHVILRGAMGDQVTYILTERVRAHSEAEARRTCGCWDMGPPRLPD